MRYLNEANTYRVLKKKPAHYFAFDDDAFQPSDDRTVLMNDDGSWTLKPYRSGPISSVRIFDKKGGHMYTIPLTPATTSWALERFPPSQLD